MAPYTGFLRRRALSVSVGAVLVALASRATALGLGELQPQSYLGEPLSAAVTLLDVRPDMAPSDLVVRVLNTSQAADLGVELFYTPPGLRAQLDTGDRPWRVQVTTPGAVKEPYLVLLLELTWAKGKIYREYALLLDLPGRARAVPAAAAANSGSRAATDRPARATLPPPLSLTPGDSYQVARGDTLWQIAERLRDAVPGAGNGELQAWLLANNPDAFINGDANRLRAGVTLQLPGTGPAPSMAASERPGAIQSAPSVPSSSAPAEPAQSPAQARETQESRTALDEEERGLLLVGAADRDDKTRELIDLLVRENEALKQRMSGLENSEYLDTLMDVIVLQREQIAELHKQLNLPDEPGPDEIELLLARLAADERAQLANRTQTAPAEGSGSADRGSPERALVEAESLAEAVPAGNPLEPEVRSQVWVYAALALLGAALAGTAVWLLARRRPPPADDEGLLLQPSMAAAPPADPAPVKPEKSAPRPSAPANRAADEWLRTQVDNQPAEGGLAVSAEELAEIEADLNPAPVKGRPIEVVKRDIARKTEDYRAGRLRRAQSLGGLELSEMVDLSDEIDTDPAKGIHRAMMLCDFKQFDQARALLRKLPLARGSRELAEALAEVDARERAQWNSPS